MMPPGPANYTQHTTSLATAVSDILQRPARERRVSHDWQLLIGGVVRTYDLHSGILAALLTGN